MSATLKQKSRVSFPLLCKRKNLPALLHILSYANLHKSDLTDQYAPTLISALDSKMNFPLGNGYHARFHSHQSKEINLTDNCIDITSILYIENPLVHYNKYQEARSITW